jgi:hypothetical protein
MGAAHKGEVSDPKYRLMVQSLQFYPLPLVLQCKLLELRSIKAYLLGNHCYNKAKYENLYSLTALTNHPGNVLIDKFLVLLQLSSVQCSTPWFML